MPVRTFLPMAAVALALGAGAGCTSSTPAEIADDAGSTQVRPAQMASSECDELAQRVEGRMPTAKGYRVPFAQADLQEAQELCRSGQPEEGMAMLRDILGYMDQEN
jgi:hypothetical protein